MASDSESEGTQEKRAESLSTESGGSSDEEEIPEFPRRFYDKGKEPPAGKSINFNSCDTALFAKLEAVLHEDEWNHLWTSPVGVCLKFYKLDFGWASRLVHYFLTFQLECHKKYEIWSLVNNAPLRFSLFEFEHITGLRCHYVPRLDEPDVPVTDEMKDFWKKMRVSMKKGPSVAELMSCLEVCETWTREERIRLGYLAIYVNFFEGLGRKTASKVSLARLCMNPTAFEAYPWGRVAFKKLMASVKAKDLTKNSYCIDGFIQPLQIWTYFALPDFGSEYGDPLPNNPTPAMLAYQGSRGRKYVKKAMLSQTRFNNFVTKATIDEMWAQWDDETGDAKVENIVRAAHGEFGVWGWSDDHWPHKGVYESNVIKLEPTEEGEPSGKDAGGGGDFAAAVQDVKDHIDACFTVYEGKVNGALAGLEATITDLGDRVGTLERTVKNMDKDVKGVVKGVDKGLEKVMKLVEKAVVKDAEKGVGDEKGSVGGKDGVDGKGQVGDAENRGGDGKGKVGDDENRDGDGKEKGRGVEMEIDVSEPVRVADKQTPEGKGTGGQVGRKKKKKDKSKVAFEGDQAVEEVGKEAREEGVDAEPKSADPEGDGQTQIAGAAEDAPAVATEKAAVSDKTNKRKRAKGKK